MSDFALSIIAWQHKNGRHDLPWQADRDPYRVWLSEIMLQQTQVGTVIPYFERFVARFPDLPSLANADREEVLAHWSGLGYYSRARNLHAAARKIMLDFDGVFPAHLSGIAGLPGIGRSTASAIAAFCFGARAAILDGNVKRVLARHFGVHGYPGLRATETRLWELAESMLPDTEIDVYTQAMMDLGALLCTRTRPCCGDCPVAGSCVALATGQVAQLPTARPKPLAGKPQKTLQFVILHHAGRVWLKQRPALGIWGGLWSFPELPAADDTLAICRDAWCLDVIEVRDSPSFKHVFSHFGLTILPRWVEIAELPLTVAEQGGWWAAPEEALTAAIPVPVRKILTQGAG